jgi:hypothetical protein
VQIRSISPVQTTSSGCAEKQRSELVDCVRVLLNPNGDWEVRPDLQRNRAHEDVCELFLLLDKKQRKRPETISDQFTFADVVRS